MENMMNDQTSNLSTSQAIPANLERLRQYVESDFWPRHRGLDEAALLILREPEGKWEGIDLFLTSTKQGFERNRILTSAMRQAVARHRPHAASVVAEMRVATDDRHAHYDKVMATFETRSEQSDALYWDLGLDSCALTFLGVGKFEAVTLGNLFAGADDCIDHWVYARTKTGELVLLCHGGSFRSSPMTVKQIKCQTYQWLCHQYQRKLNRKAVLKSLKVSYSPLV